MVKTVRGSLAALLLFLQSGTVQATPVNSGAITIIVSAQTSYTGAPSTAALVADYQAVAQANNVTGGEACWPMNDSIQSSGTGFVNACTTAANYIDFNNDSSGFVTGFASPIIATPNDSLSTQFNSQSARMNTGTYLSATAPWSVGFGINPGGAITGSMDILNTGAPTQGTGMEAYINSTGHVVISLAGTSPFVVTTGDTSGTHTQFAWVTWSPTSGTGGVLSIYVRDSVTGVTTTSANHPISSWVAGTTPLGIVYPASGSGTGAFSGYMAWPAYFPAVLTPTQVTTLLTDATGTQPAPPAINASAPVTLAAYTVANNLGFDSEFSYGSGVIEGYQTNATLRNIKFLNVHHLRDAPNQAGYPLYSSLTSNNITFSQGYQVFAGNSGTAGNTSPALLTVSDVTSKLDAIKTAYGAYPYFIEPENEIDNYKDLGKYSNHFGYDDAVNPASPNTACTAITSTCDVPRWAYYAVEQMQTLRAAVNSNAKYTGILVYGAGLANPGSYPTLSQAQYDVCVTLNKCGANFSSYNNSNNYAYGALFPVDSAVQHSNVSSTGGLPSDATSGGLTQTIIGQVYVKETTSGHSPSGGFSGYAAPGTAGAIPQTFDEVGIGQETMYYASGNDIDNPLAVHYAQRDLVKMTSLGLTNLEFDFIGDKASQVLGTPFAQLGWTDVLGNLKPMGYAVANMERLVGYGETSPRSTIQQLSFKAVTPGTSTTPSNLQAYSFQKTDGTYWLALVDNTAESTTYPNAGQQNLKANQPAPYPTLQPGNTPCVSQSSNPNQDNCFNLSFQGKHANFVGFTTVNITGLPSSITHAAVYQNDEYCNNTLTQDSTPWGVPLPSHPSGANTDCEQYWPAGSLTNTIQPSYPTVSGNAINGVKFNGSVLWIHLGSSQLTPVPTMTPMPYTSAPTPGPGSAVPATRQTPLATPIPQFGPPTGVVPTPPA